MYIAIMVVVLITLLYIIKRNSKCSHPIKSRTGRAKRIGKGYPFLEISCKKCGEMFDDEPLINAPLDYIKQLCRQNFLTKEEIKIFAAKKELKNIMDYNIFIDG